MAAVTVNTKKLNVNGSMRDNAYNITGADTNTLDVGLYNVRGVTLEPSTITAYTLTAATPNAGMTRITFSASGPFTGVDLRVYGN